ncbi:GntR family transcriptional regulator [Marinomonas sp. 2405UD68-3]|uniref:GntR family transcriptional regulator n=1 Tax=Marinomonas sp. 2405UD68-3 TaxID=3391835 RepID=UPI0039C9824E
MANENDAQKIKKPIKKEVNNDIYHTLRKLILDGALAGGAPLRQDDIAEQFGVSKIPVREVFRKLESDGLVEFRPRRGVFVTEHTEAEILEMLEIRIALESRALELSIPQMTDLDIELAREILKEYEEVEGIEVWSDLNRRFHDCIYAPCGLMNLISMIHSVVDRTGSFMRLKVTMASGFDRPHSEHVDILKACEAGDVDKGVDLLRKHIERTKKEVAAHFRRQSLSILSSS